MGLDARQIYAAARRCLCGICHSVCVPWSGDFRIGFGCLGFARTRMRRSWPRSMEGSGAAMEGVSCRPIGRKVSRTLQPRIYERIIAVFTILVSESSMDTSSLPIGQSVEVVPSSTGQPMRVSAPFTVPSRIVAQFPLDLNPKPADNIPTRQFDLSLPARNKYG